MYCPAVFSEDNPDAHIALIGQHPLATIVRNSPDGLEANHIPLMFETTADGRDKLIGHVAKANPLWQCAPAEELLVIFQGPATYISPNWYATKQEHGKVAPTWNYAVVHAHCSLTALHDPEHIRRIITTLNDQQESTQAHPWLVTDAPEAFINHMLGNVVGIELAINRMQGKWKVNQNQPAVNRASVVQGLLVQGGDVSVQMARLVEAGGAK